MPDQENAVPDVYVDQMQITTGVYGVNITFGLNEPHPSGGMPQPPEEKARVRMSLQHAKITAMILRQQQKNYELETGTSIQLPANVYTGLGIAQEDW